MSHTTNTPPSRPNDLLSILTIIASSLFIFVTIFTTLLICAIRFLPKVFNNPFSLHARAPVLQLFASWGLCLQLTAWTFVATIPNMNCATIMILSNIGWYSLMMSVLLRAWRLYYIYHWNAREIKEILNRERMEKRRNRLKYLRSKRRGHTSQVKNVKSRKNSLDIGSSKTTNPQEEKEIQTGEENSDLTISEMKFDKSQSDISIKETDNDTQADEKDLESSSNQATQTNPVPPDSFIYSNMHSNMDMSQMQQMQCNTPHYEIIAVSPHVFANNANYIPEEAITNWTDRGFSTNFSDRELQRNTPSMLSNTPNFQSPQGIFSRIRQSSNVLNDTIGYKTLPRFIVSPFTLSGTNGTQSPRLGNYTRLDDGASHQMNYYGNLSPMQQFSLVPNPYPATYSHPNFSHPPHPIHNSSFQLYRNDSPNSCMMPPISPQLQNNVDNIPSMGRLNLTYRDHSSNQPFVNMFSNGVHRTYAFVPNAGITQQFDDLLRNYNVMFPYGDPNLLTTNIDQNDMTNEDYTDNVLSGNDEIVSDWVEILQLNAKESTANINKKRANEKNLLLFLFIGFIPLLIFLVPTALIMPKFFIPHAFMCDINRFAFPTSEMLPRNPNQFPILEFLLSIISIFLMLIAIIKLRKVRDTYHLNTELRILGTLITLGAFLYGIVVPLASFIVIIPLSLFFLWYILLLIPMIYYPHVYVIKYWGRSLIKRLRQSKREGLESQNSQASPKANVSTYNLFSLNYIMENQTLREMLKKYMVHSLCSELITFYEQVSIFCNLYDEEFPDASMKLANSIVETYLLEDCPKPIRLPKQMRNEIIQTVGSCVDSVPKDTFDKASRYVMNKIRKDGTFSSFKRSKRFRKWLRQQKEKNIERVAEEAGGLVDLVSI